MESTLHSLFLRSPPNLFDAFVAECQRWYDEPAHTFTEMRTRDNKKIRGDIFEDFCVLYLRHVKGFPNVWRLPDVPAEVLETLALKRQDFGIDIVCERNGVYTAVQCKYKKHTGYKSKTIVTWKQLSTFYALCMRTGPWDKYIVMTNCDYVRHMGKKTPKDLSICLRRFQGITHEEWVRMCGLTGQTLASSPTPVRVLTPAELRAARVARFTASPPQLTNADGVHDASASTAQVHRPVADPP